MGTQSGDRPLAGTMIAPLNTAGLNVRFTPKSGHSRHYAVQQRIDIY